MTDLSASDSPDELRQSSLYMAHKGPKQIKCNDQPLKSRDKISQRHSARKTEDRNVSEKSPQIRLILQHLFAIPTRNSFVEHAFSIMKILWNNERNRLTVEIVKAELYIEENVKFSFVEFYLLWGGRDVDGKIILKWI
ncbi:hypothetical protein ANN_07270 [Periplaneta americana]|uniref:Uncharacterized protein n=1 Tax=Periplaneta americana TaxID=6978 RepID=A0ABQ8THR1_PERAM|nr:hypothetical protein ANN_07270 [Periplaneta americana]